MKHGSTTHTIVLEYNANDLLKLYVAQGMLLFQQFSQ